MSPAALLITGPPASGKTTLGRALAAELGGCLLDMDVLTGALTEAIGELVGTADLDAPALSGRIRVARYESLLATAEDNLRVGVPVVLIAPFTAERTDPAAWAAARDRLSAAGGAPRLVWLRLPADELLRRLRVRAAGRDAAKLADPNAFLARHPLTPPVVEHHEVDATEDLTSQLGGILSSSS
ncbi:MAG TPA: ATP-binding protein [Pseudonocardiaceae bacterium]|nr:ATP-binding protein [Pseudonocardiaceae bacterium]